MMAFLLSFVFLALVPNPQEIPRIDPNMHSYEMRQKKQYRVDHFNFSEAYPQLENIDIDGRRLKEVELDLSGEFPVLESVNFEGSFGNLSGKLTGSFPVLKVVNILCSSAAMEFDLCGGWERDCKLKFRGSKGDIILKIPENVGVIVNVKKTLLGSIKNEAQLEKKKRGLNKKTFVNSEYGKAPITLTIDAELTEGTIYLK